MPSKLRCNIQACVCAIAKHALLPIGLGILGFVGPYYLIEKGITGLSAYRKEQQYQPSQRYVNDIGLWGDYENLSECRYMESKHPSILNHCLDIVDSLDFQSGDVSIYAPEYYPSWLVLFYTVNNRVSILLSNIQRLIDDSLESQRLLVINFESLFFN